jgi:tRNA pseudouridine32 synthase/23S rRNA pseudouridine746 synthase
MRMKMKIMIMLSSVCAIECKVSNNSKIRRTRTQQCRDWTCAYHAVTAFNVPSNPIRGVTNRPKHTKRKRENDSRYVDWAGSSGILQNFRNVMEKKDYAGWLKKPLPSSWEEEITPHAINTNSDSGNKFTADRKAFKPLDPNFHLQPLYADQHIVVVNKESGVLSVPGPNQKPSVGGLVHAYFGNEEDDVDCMIVHRLDMDTSGVICYARSKHVLSVLHDAFRSKSGVGTGDETVYKKYEALICGHLNCSEGEIDLPLVRDRYHPPFMKVGIDGVESENNQFDDEHLQKHKGYVKMMKKPPKQSLTLFRVIGREFLQDLPVTRLELVPITGRTHQLRVHCAAIGHPIIGDTIYGFKGNGSPDGGLSSAAMSQFQSRASDSVQSRLHDLVQKRREEHSDGEYNGNLTLHAKQLNLFHPITKAPMSFENDAPF